MHAHTRSLMNSSQSVTNSKVFMASFRRGGRERKNAVAIEEVVILLFLLSHEVEVGSLPGRLHAGGGTFMDTE